MCNERIGREQAADPAANNHDMGPLACHHRAPATPEMLRKLIDFTLLSTQENAKPERNAPCSIAISVQLRAALAAAALLVVSAPGWAQDYPNRPVKIIVPFPAGGSADVVPRIVGDWLSKKWGQPVVVENPTGAAGNIGAALAYRADPDGYTLLSAPPPPLVINHNLYPNLAFDPLQFEPVIVLAQIPNSLIVNPDKIAAKSVPEFIA